jgi:hypothetical protein
VKGGKNRLFYIGTLYPMYTMSLSEAEAVLVSKMITKKVEIPSQDEMKRDIDGWIKK